MQSNLREINIKSVLLFLLKEQKSGILSVEIPSKNSLFLHLSESYFQSTPEEDNRYFKYFYLINGEITYACNSEQHNLKRLKDYLHHYQIESILDEYLTNIPLSDNPQIREYSCLMWLLQHEYLQPLQIKTIIVKLIEETIFDILLFQQGKMSFQVNHYLHPICNHQLSTHTIGKLNRKLKQWKQFSPYILSPHQFLGLEDRAYLKNKVSDKTYEHLTSWTDNHQSLIQLSRQLDCSLISLGKALYPYIQKGLLTLQMNPKIFNRE